MVLVTGAAGHVGSALVRELLAEGEKVRALVLPDEELSGLEGLDVEIVFGNVLDRDALRSAMRGIDVVYHLAGIVSILPGRNDLMRTVNVVGTAAVARVARESLVRRMVYVSSIHALARPPRGTPIDESVRFDPHNTAGEYDQTKAEASLAVLAEVERGLDAVLLCPTGIIGPFDFRSTSALANQVRAWMKPGWHVTVNGQFDFVDVRDVGRAMILASRSGKRGETYIVSGERISVGRLFALVRRSAQASGRSNGGAILVPFGLAMLAAELATIHAKLWKCSVQFTRYSLETLVSNSVIDGTKAHRDLGYQPRPMAETVRDTVGWLSQQAAVVPSRRAGTGRARVPDRGPSRSKPPARVAVVTGASSGIGAATATRLGSLGYRVVLVARREDRLQELAAEIRRAGGAADVLALDLSDPNGIRAVYDHVTGLGEGLDVLVNSAGFGWYGYGSDMPVQTAGQMVAVNSGALAQLIVLFLPLMRARGRGCIINVSSIAGSFASPWSALYSATKSFADTFTRALHRELRGTGVSVCAVRPGPVLTEFYQTVSRLSEGRSIPVERFATRPETVVDAIVSLLRRPRPAVYVPRGFAVLPWLELSLGWLFDQVAALLLRRQGSAA